jgi:cysteine desulfurase/selenocysteine lyase
MSATAPAAARTSSVDWSKVRGDFPILQRKVHGKPLVYLDSANTSQKPRQVIEAVDSFYREHNANVSRAVHQLSEEATALYEGARTRLAAFLGANHRDEIVLTSGTRWRPTWSPTASCCRD